MDVSAWLNGLGMGEHAQSFADNEIDAATLNELTADDLKELGVVKLGQRKRLLAAIASLGQPEAAPPPAATAPAGERRQVTVLFADLSGFTKLSSERDAEETHALLNTYFTAVDGVVDGYGGAVDKHIGDAVMAVFGAPVAHGNDPERALRAALDIHRAVAELEPPMQVHVGVASGQVVASGTGSEAHREYTVTGDTVNLASRLQDMASSGDTLISDEVHRSVADLVACEPLEAVSIKGLDGAVRVWRVLGARIGEAVAKRRPLVGRRSELRQFAGAADACLETGSGQAIYVRGEAGIGKSRLVEECLTVAEAKGFARHTGLVLDFGVGKGQDAIRAVVRSLLGIAVGAGKTGRAAAAEQALADGLLERDRQVFVNDLLDLPQPTELRAMYDAMDNATRNRGQWQTVAELVRRSSARQPVVIAIEDLHLADSIMLAHLSSLAGAVADCPALLIMTSRIEGDPLDQAWRTASGGAPLMTMDLGPLRTEDAVELAGAFLDASHRLAMRCVERAEGNPLFLEQLLRSAEETTGESLPGSVQSIVLARMDNLDPHDKQALQAATVIGHRFSLDLLRHLIDSPQYTCAALVEHTLVRPEGEDYLFAQSLIREGVYASLLNARKRALHQAAAAWFETRDPMLRAEHLDRAEDPAAAQAYLSAARAQVADYRFERALQMVERGLGIAGDRATTHELTCFQGEILRDLGDIEKSIDAFNAALESADDDAGRCRAWIGLAAGMRVVDRYDDALEVLQLAEVAAGAHGLAAERAQIHYYRGNIFFPMGNIDGCLEQHELARKAAREAGTPADEARALSGLADAYYMRGRMTKAYDHFNRCIELCREHGFGRIAVANLQMRGITRYFQNDLDAALEDARTALETAARVGHHRAEIIARSALSLVTLDMGNLTEGKQIAELGLNMARRLGARRFEAVMLTRLAKIHALEGHSLEANKTLEEALTISRETGVGFIGPWILGALAGVTDDPAARRRALDEGEELLRKGSVGHNYFQFYREAIDASLGSQDWDGADRFAGALEAYTSAEPLPWSDLIIARGRALAAHGRGNRDAAVAAELRRLRDEADRVGLKVMVPALDAALGAE